MNIIPIVFAFDNNLILPACVCISSLLMNANKDTFYDIFILHSETELLEKEEINKLYLFYSNCKITYVLVTNEFEDGYEVRGITKATYYRLLIPQLITQYDKIIYSDVDVIFRSDLSDLYKIDIENEYVAATYDLGMILSDTGRKHINKLSMFEQCKYMQAGFILMNSKKMRMDSLIETFQKLYRNKYKYQDQDLLNIVCIRSHKLLPFKYNMTNYVFYYLNKKHDYFSCFSKEVIDEALEKGTIHYNGQKPWKGGCINFDIWWEYYRKSPFFDKTYYFDFFDKMLNELDCLTLWKRIKVLLRYFVYGRYNS